MKIILAFILIFVMIMSSVACTKKKDEPDDAVIVDNDIDVEVTDDTETEKTEKEDQSEDKTQTPAPDDEKTNEDDKTVIPDNSEKEDVTEKPEQTPTQTPEKEPDSSTEKTPEKKPDEQTEKKPEEKPKEEPVIYDDSNATPASSFEYRVDKDKKSVSIIEFIGNEKEVVIPNYIEGYPVKSLGMFFCSADSSVESVTISENIEIIYEQAFYGCQNLKTVITKSKNLVIKRSAFESCSSLNNLTLGEGVVEVGASAFRHCTSLRNIHIPSTLNKCGTGAFGGITIEKLTFADGIETVGSSSCFVPAYGERTENSFKTVTIPASVKNLVTLSFGDNLQEIVFLGNAPKAVGDETLLPENVVVKYKKGTTGWDDRVWKDYKLVEIE